MKRPHQISKLAQQHDRRGAMIVLMVFCFTVTIAFAAVAVNTAFLRMARVELKNVTDLAAKSGATYLGNFQNTTSPTSRIENVLNWNRPQFDSSLGRPDYINTSVIYGHADIDEDGSITFTANGEPENAVQVTATYPAMFNGSNVPVPFFFTANPSITATSIAMRTDNDVCFVLDRSGSMAWDMSNEEFSYPAGGSELQNYYTPPDPVDSRWAALRTAVEDFVVTCEEDVPGEVRIGLVSFSSDFTFGVFESERGTMHERVTRDRRATILPAVDAIGAEPLIGDTDIGYGLSLVPDAYTGGQVRSKTGVKTVVLFSDGVNNEGNDPVSEAAVLGALGYTVHTVSFSDQADQAMMLSIANAGGGTHYHASSADELREAFKEIARSLPGSLIQ